MLIILNVLFLAVNLVREPKKPIITTQTDLSIPQLTLLTEMPVIEETIKVASNETQKEALIDLKTWMAKFTAKTETKPIQINEPKVELVETKLEIEEKIEPKKEVVNLVVAEAVNVDIVKSKPKTKTLEPVKQPSLQCYTAGPFQNQENLQQATLFLKNSKLKFKQRSILEKQYIGMLVYIPSQKTRTDIIAIAKNLASKGIKDYRMLNEPGKKNSLSIGVYGLKKNADRQIKILSKLNYKAESEARYRKKTIYWLDYNLIEKDEQRNLSSQRMKSLNVSQIERNCKT